MAEAREVYTDKERERRATSVHPQVDDNMPD
jgi:hypothetical protein